MKKIFYMIVFLMLGTLGNLSAQITLFKGTFDEALKKAQQEKKDLFVDFFAEWCGPCKMMHPVLEQLKADLGDSIRIIKLDVDKSGDIAEAYRIQSVPTLMLFRRGEMLWRQSGAMRLADLKATISNYQ